MAARAFLFLLLAVAGALPARAAEPLVADLSEHLVAITTGFTGTDVLLFGAVDQPGDVVVVVRGPSRDEVVRRKVKVGPIWVNGRSAEIRDVPAFYWVGSTRSLIEIAPASVFERLRIGVENLNLPVRSGDPVAKPADYMQALVRLKRERDLFYRDLGEVVFLGNRLFRVNLFFPANVPVGTYSVEVYLLDDGEVISGQTTPLIISKVGVGADIFDFAHDQAAIYGLLSVLLAGLAGWVAALAFRKG